VTYVRQGCLVFREPLRRDEFLGPGCYQRASSQPLMLTGGAGGAPFRGAHLFVSSLTPHRSEGDPSLEHRHYPFSDRRGILRLIASPDGSDASLRLRKDARIYSSVMDPGHHLVHQLEPGRGVWLHVVEGLIRLIDQDLSSGDGASLDEESAVSFTAQEASEILLFDLA
jgi:redox-sensitive bicupin YhaK (pirin superfamily)